MLLRHLLTSLLFVLLAWSNPALARDPPLKVVASFSVLADLVKEIGGDRVAVVSIVGPDADAHVYEPTPSDVMAIAGANVVVMNGLGFEGWMDRLTASSGFRGRLVVAGSDIKPLRSGDRIDPHAWQDPKNVIRYVNRISAALASAQPADAAAFAVNAERYRRELWALDAEIRESIGAIPSAERRFVTSHDAFGYFARAYGFTILSPQGWSTDDEASARDVAALITQLKQGQVRAVFLENISDPRLIEQIAAEGNARVGGRLYSDALDRPGTAAGSYLGMMRHNLRALVGALRDR
jgi:zinc/manganese transport system substrate-binding protein